MNTVIPLRAFKDNYIWALHSPEHSALAVIDPGDPAPVLSYLDENNLTLSVILITHHHHDHTGGVLALCERFPEVNVYGPGNEEIKNITTTVKEGDLISLYEGSPRFKIMEIPGHTKGHIAYYNNNMIFCGDTLFSCGCGRLFEGTATQLYTSLQKINQLNGNTLIYCAHEYTLANLKFAQLVDPNNPAIQQRIQIVSTLHARGQPSLPVTLHVERETNPFLRCNIPTIKKATENHFQTSLTTPLAVFAALRQWKDQF